MITIISGTNRVGARTKVVAAYYDSLLTEMGIPHQFLSLEGKDIFTRNDSFIAIEKEFLAPSHTFIILLPEYNGTFPGIFKLLIDNSDIKQAWRGKEALLVGVADGRGGNLRGLDQLTNVLNYLGARVFPTRVHISQVSKSIAEGRLSDEAVEREIKNQVEQYFSNRTS